MAVFTVHAAKTQLSKLIEQACAGEDVVIARGTEPVVRLVPIQHVSPRRRFGALSHQLTVPPSFFEPLPTDELDGWE